MADAHVARDVVRPVATTCDEALSTRLAAMDPKEVFGEAMGRAAETDDLLAVVVSDYGRRLSLERVRELRPEAVVQCGIAEQSQVGLAAAMALEGLHVVAPAYACFLTSRALDQVRVAMGIMGAPLVLVGLGPGYASGVLGASHMSLDDVALMRAVPGIDVVCPADNAELWCCLLDLARDPRPCYVRMPSAPAGRLLRPACAGLPRGRALPVGAAGVPAAGEAPDVALLASGSVTLAAAEAAEALRSRGVSCSLAEVPWVGPLDEGALDAAAAARLVVTDEEHQRSGGLGGAVAERLLERAGAPRLLRLGAPDEVFEADDQDRLLERAGLSAAGVERSVMGALGAG